MEILKFKSARVVVFPTLTEAMASSYVLGYGDIAMVANDPSTIRIAAGTKISFDTPPAPSGKTYAKAKPISGSAGSFANSFAANATATLTAAQLLYRYIKSTSAAATTLTLDTATNIGAALGATQGSEFDFEIDNSAGANIVTVAVGTGITAATPVITGGATLTVAAGTFGKFKLIFKDATHALLFRTL